MFHWIIIYSQCKHQLRKWLRFPKFLWATKDMSTRPVVDILIGFSFGLAWKFEATRKQFDSFAIQNKRRKREKKTVLPNRCSHTCLARVHSDSIVGRYFLACCMKYSVAQISFAFLCYPCHITNKIAHTFITVVYGRITNADTIAYKNKLITVSAFAQLVCYFVRYCSDWRNFFFFSFFLLFLSDLKWTSPKWSKRVCLVCLFVATASRLLRSKCVRDRSGGQNERAHLNLKWRLSNPYNNVKLCKQSHSSQIIAPSNKQFGNKQRAT